jgi:hypothetical protein
MVGNKKDQSYLPRSLHGDVSVPDKNVVEQEVPCSLFITSTVSYLSGAYKLAELAFV